MNLIDDELKRIERKLLRPIKGDEMARRAEWLNAERLRIHEQTVRLIRADWNAPYHHASITGSSCRAPWFDAFRKISGRIGTGFLIALIGPRGTGKTQMAVELMRSVTEQERSARYETAVRLVMRFRGAMHRGAEDDLMDELAGCRLLVIDEFGKKADSEWADGILYELIDARYKSHGRDTLLIAPQVSSGKFKELVGDSIGSRMNERGGVVECNWPSFRE